MSGAAMHKRADGRQRVVITGMGIVSCLGNTLDEVSQRLRDRHGGIARVDAWRARGFGSQVAGVASVNGEPAFDRKLERFMGDTARYACHAARSAVADAALSSDALRSLRAGAVIGSGMGALTPYDEALAIAHTRGVERTPPYVVPQSMNSTTSANVAQVFGIEGVVYSPSSACTTSALAIGQAMQLIASGSQDLVLAGGSEGLHDNTALMFDAMGALSTHRNDEPDRASCPYDVRRSGFVIASGAGILVLESLAHARARGARIYAELTGFGQCTDGANMVAPRATSIARSIRLALDDARLARPDYVNAHAPSTPRGDLEELHALTSVFGEASMPTFSSTKGMTGHPPGACCAHEAIYTLLMMRDRFVAGSRVEALEPMAATLPLVQDARACRVDTALSVSFGFGGSCASLTFDSSSAN